MKNIALHIKGTIPGPGCQAGSGFHVTPVEKCRRAIFLFFFLFAAAPLFSQASIWSGDVNSDWMNPGNWIGQGPPQPNSDVIIFDEPNDPVISSAGAFGRTLRIEAGAVLTITAAGTLTIDCNASLKVLENLGTVHNHGTINLTDGDIGIENDNHFTNYAEGNITIDRQSYISINNEGSFINAGSITIGATGNAGGTGIRNLIAFSNTGGQITIDRTTQEGIFNMGGFENNAILTIGGVAGVGISGIKNFTTFNNNAGGQITIDRSTEQGILVQTGTIQNAGMLTIGGVASPGNVGLACQGTFNNNPGGQLTIDRSIYVNLGVYGGVFTNDATVLLSSTPGTGITGIVSNGTSNNNACAEIEMFGQFSGPSGGSFTNAGLFTLHSASSHTNNGSLINDGIIEYRHDNPIPNVTNNDLIVKDIAGGCGASLPALQIGGANSFTPASTWYKDVAQTQVAGTYNLASNTFTPANLPGTGTIPLYFNVTDNANGCTEAVTLDYTIANDVTPPTVVCKTATVNLNAAGTGSITTGSVFQSGSDNCGTVNQVSVTPSAFTCANVGANTVTLTVNDGNGNTATCTATVTVTDNSAPTVVCKNAMVNLNASGAGSITTGSVLQSGSDNCGTVNQVSVAPNVFTCANIGANTVMLTVNDGHGNTATCTATVTVADNSAPTVVCKNATVNLNASGSAGITTGSVFQSGSDNCGTVNQVSVAPNAFTCANIGANMVTLTVNDGHGNTGTCTATVTVADNSAPAIACPANTTVSANGSCQASLAAYSPVAVSDNCGAPTVTQLPVAGTMIGGGANTVTLRATDAAGNSGSCTFTVTVSDQIAPTITCPAHTTVAANASCQATLGNYAASATASDNCTAAPTKTQVPAAGATLGLGATTATLRATDAAGNSASCTFTVTVTDQTLPAITCPANTTVAANASCQASLAAYSSVSASDNCGAPAISQLPAAGTTVALGTTAVTLRATDAAGNSASCTFTVTVTDQTAPTITCPANTTVAAGATCQTTLGNYAASATASDNCTAAPTRTQVPATGTTLGLGAALVTLRATDAAGNSGTCAFVVTVADQTPPSITCPANATVSANASCSGAVGSYAAVAVSDNCAANPAVSQSPAAGTALNGHNDLETVTLTASDGQGNTQSCTFTVTLKDLTPPSITCPANATVSADGSCSGAVGSYAAVAVSDNCTASPTVSQSPAAGTALNGHNDVETVTLTASDGNGNTQSCTFTVTLKDLTPPVARCKNATINLGSNGTVTVLPASINNVSTDNCAFGLTLTPAIFGCANIGLNTVTLKATDGGGNTSTCTAIVTIRDLTPPTALCKNITVFLDGEGHASITPPAVNNNSFDACGIATMSINNSEFDCSQISSPVPVQLTLKDVNNNQSSCYANVTVRDAIAPMAECDNTTVELGSNGYATVSSAGLASNSTDNCSVWSYNPAVKVYTTANIGVNNLTITVKDYSNNAATCVSQVTVLPYGSGSNLLKPNHHYAQPDNPEATSGAEVLQVSAFPNPTAGASTVTFRLPEEQPYRLRMFDLNGRLVMDLHAQAFSGENSTVLQLDELMPGVYLLEVQGAGIQGRQKLVVQR